MIKFLPQILMATCIIVEVFFYLVGIKQGKVRPILATWLFLTFATTLSLIADYKENGMNGILSNAFNLMDVCAGLIIFLVVLFLKDTRREFTVFEKWCFGVVFFIFIGWVISGQNVLAHLSIQAILVVAYLPLFIHLWRATRNTESLGAWLLNGTASVFGLIEPIKTLSFLPIIYVSRSIISCFLVIILILRLIYKDSISKKQNLNI